ncbi:MAG: GAF domain-containing protein [Actinobacteria bacterium]|nr:MAG: GAF domain-containing protein [Actinomycetota bacterium]
MRNVESYGGAVTGSPLADELRSLAQLRMLHSLAQRLNELNDVRQIGEAITAELHTVIEYHNCRVHLLSEDGQLLVPIAFRGELSEYQGETFEALLIPFGAGITGRVAETGESHYAANTAEDPAAVNIAGTPDVDESLIVVPMRYGSNVIGTVALAKLGVDQFDDEDVRLLEVLAAHAAVAIENARLYERERNSAQVARELLKFSQTLTGAHDMESVLSEAIRTIPAMILCASVRVYLRDPTGAFRVAASVEGEAEAWAEPLVVPADVAQRFLLSTQEPFVLTMETIAAVPEPYRGRGDREAIIAPLHWEPDGFGAIAISGDPRAGPAGTGFSSRDLELARGIADIASLALGKAGRFRELEEAAERLRALDEMKNMFLDAVSHELRTPLAAVLGIALTLGRPEIDLSEPEARDLITRLQTNARKLERLLSDLLDLDRLVRGIVEPNRRPTDVGALVRGVVDAAELPGDHEITVQADTLVLPVDAAKVERIVENLLANAARHAPDATGIWVSATASDGGVLITVEDNGPGVPPELRAAVFEPFRQGPDRSQHSPGVGIGLSLVARFAEIHGGRAWVEDRPGGGASFRVFIPAS